MFFKRGSAKFRNGSINRVDHKLRIKAFKTNSDKLVKLIHTNNQWRIQKILVGGDLKHKTSKIRMSSPKLRLIFRPKSEIQTFFSPKFRWSPKKKKKKVFTKIETDFSPDWLRLGRWGGMHPEMEPIYSKQRLIFRPKSLLLGWWGGMHPPHPPP